MTIIQSEEWSNAHFAVNEALNELLGALRDAGYNPSLHFHYDKAEHHLLVDEDILRKHSQVARTFDRYLHACTRRDEAVQAIEAQPKLDLGF